MPAGLSAFSGFVSALRARARGAPAVAGFVVG